MNERIRLLAEQASHQSPDGYPVTIPYSKDFAVKFAELIMAECVRKIEDIAESSNDPQPIYRVAVELLEHFGVEE